jgi:hypothetical protein
MLGDELRELASQLRPPPDPDLPRRFCTSLTNGQLRVLEEMATTLSEEEQARVLTQYEDDFSEWSFTLDGRTLLSSDMDCPEDDHAA